MSEEALFRYVVVAEVLSRIRGGESKKAAVHAVAASAHYRPNGSARKVSVRTLYRWLAAYKGDGLKALEPKRRGPVGTRIPLEFLFFLEDQKRKDKRASVPELIRRALKLGIIREKPDRVTVYRACKRLGLTVARLRKLKDRDTRRFAYPHRMDMLLCDGKHFRAGSTRAKRMAFVWLDDATRFALHVVVGTSENKSLFLRGLFEMICRWGLMDILYLDHGPGFIAGEVVAVLGNLRSVKHCILIHGETAYPPGHGKIERFNRTFKSDVLRGLDHRPDVDPSCKALELRLGYYLQEIYNHRPHEGLGNDTPASRFLGDTKPLVIPTESIQALRDRFVIHIKRRVSNDHVVSVDSVPYEVPRGLAGENVVIHRQVLDGTLRLLHEGRLIDLHPVDPHLNARTRRARPDASTEEDQDHPLPPSEADLGFQSDFGPVVDPDGGFSDPDDDPEETPV